MARSAARIAVIQFCLGVGIAAILARSVQLQLVQGQAWAERAVAQRTAREELPARRGTIYDRSGVPLAVTQEFYRIGIAPNEVTSRSDVARLVGRRVGVPAARLDREMRRKKYVYLHGPFTATQVQPLRGVPGIHLEGEYQRFYPSRDLARPIIGRFDTDRGLGGSGLELALDSILTGVPGEAIVLKDHRGRRYDSPARLAREPVPGHDVVLSIDAELQDIAERALDEAVTTMEADGGDVVFLNPATGELLALASQQRRGGSASSERAATFTDVFQPGSTAKLFTAAALMMRRRVDSTDTVNGENGEWFMPVRNGRTFRISDSHKEPGNLTLAEAIEVSSNIAMAKFSQRLSPAELYETLRDFGFGSPTGAEFPSEARGILNRPDRWTPEMSRASISFGYEYSVTPVQLAAAYGVLANDGVLLTPTLVREVRRANGELLYQHQPEPVRRVVTPEVARKLRDFLRGAVSEHGTGIQGQLANYTLLGKTGTARSVRNGRYVPGEYTSTFAALFPADDPQLVVIVKIDTPRKGGYYGGLTAAPVTKTMLEQALASQRTAIDRTRLTPPTPRVTRAGARVRIPESSRPRIVVPWPGPTDDSSAAAARPVPEVAGLSVREAALALHSQGFRVELEGLGRVRRSDPATGEPASPGSTVTIWAEQ